MLFFSTHVHIFKRHITCTTRIGMKGSKISGKNAPQHSISTMQMEHTDRFIRRFGMAFLSKIRSQQEKRETDTNKAGTLFGAGLHPQTLPRVHPLQPNYLPKQSPKYTDSTSLKITSLYIHTYAGPHNLTHTCALTLNNIVLIRYRNINAKIQTSRQLLRNDKHATL